MRKTGACRLLLSRLETVDPGLPGSRDPGLFVVGRILPISRNGAIFNWNEKGGNDEE
jgi:hypothetical protein